jgi:hypothetical protein
MHNTYDHDLSKKIQCKNFDTPLGMAKMRGEKRSVKLTFKILREPDRIWNVMLLTLQNMVIA